MKLNSSISKTFGRGVYIDRWSVAFQRDLWTLWDWIWDRTEFQKGAHTHCMHNLAIF